MTRALSSIAVYCGSHSGFDPIYTQQATALGKAMAARGSRLIYGGGNVGLMGTVADAALDAGGLVTGIIPEQLIEWEVVHRGVSELEVVPNMHVRKMRMFDLADGFIAMPGGFGTLDEMFEMLTWRQIGIADKPCAFLDVNGFYAPMLDMIDSMVERGFVNPAQRADLFVSSDIDEVLNWMEQYIPADASKWLTAKSKAKSQDLR